MAVNRFHLASVLDPEIIAGVTVVIIIGQINKTNRLINLEGHGFDFVGRISYGVYIYHPLLIFLLAKVLGPLAIPALPKYLLVYAVVTGSTLLISYLSFTYFESYFLKLKARFTVVKSAATSKETNTSLEKRTAVIADGKES